MCHELESLILTGSIRLEEFARELKHSDRRASYMCHGPTLVPTLIRHSGSKQQLYENWPVQGLSRTRDSIGSWFLVDRLVAIRAMLESRLRA